MKKHSKVGNRAGKPAFRTPSRFIANKAVDVRKGLLRKLNQSKTNDR